MNREDILLIALGSDADGVFSPVQIQKTVFLFQKLLKGVNTKESFNFEPYHYGPFDADIYRYLKELNTQGLVIIDQSATSIRKYSLSESGKMISLERASQLEPKIVTALKTITINIKKLSFSELVNLIYNLYPETKVNSIFAGLK